MLHDDADSGTECGLGAFDFHFPVPILVKETSTMWRTQTNRPSARLAILLVGLLVTVLAGSSTANAAGLLVADKGSGGILQIKEQDVRVTINNGIAVTEVDQVFVNTENRVVEALYTFPVPKHASVSNFSMWIAGKEMIGEVVEKERARQIYESYKQVRRDPGLLEQVDYKRFEMRIFPIPAGAEQRVHVTYCQELDFDHDRASYVYPLATVTQTNINQTTTGRFSFNLDVKSQVPITAMKSSSHADQLVTVPHADRHYWQASLETKQADLSRDLVIGLELERPATGIDLIASKTSQEDGYFQLTVTAGKELESKLKGSDYVFVLDISGSMMHDGKLGLSRGAIDAFVQSLGDDDRFEVITFNIAATPLFGSITPVSADTRKQASDFLATRKAMGGTVLQPAIEAAYRYYNADRQLNVVVLSDGMTEQREQTELLKLIKQRPTGSSVFCVGVGNEVNRPLLGQLASETGGLATFLSSGDDFEAQALAFRRKLTRPAATNVKISFTGVDVYDLEPATLPNLYYGQPVRMYGRYKKNGPAKVQLNADVLGAPLAQSIDINLPGLDATNPEIERMWAWHRVDRLMADGRRDGNGGRVDEIVRLSEGYSIANEYASFIVLENDSEYQRWKIDRRNAIRVGRDRSAQLAVRQKLESLRRQTAGQVGPNQTSPVANKQTINNESLASAANSASPQNVNPSINSPQRPNNFPPDASTAQRSSGGGGGGGAIDPITAVIGAGLAGFAWRNRKRRGGSPTAA